MNLTKLRQITKGAEAIIYSGSFLEKSVIIKHRLPKSYRHPDIDTKIRLQRLRGEAKITNFAWRIGVKVPCLLSIDRSNYKLILEKIEGVVLYDKLKSQLKNEFLSLFLELGVQVGLLHTNDIIHGDLTVFNVIVSQNGDPWIIDFGLSKISNEIEAKADDLLTFYSTLKAIHQEFEMIFHKFLEGYLDKYLEGKNTYEQMKKIQSRARYIAREDRL
jgi:TP53 regulating kinase-like protein